MSKIFSKNKSATWFWRNTPNTSATTVQQRDSLFNSSNWVLQVHIRTSPDASPENVGVFVGSDPTDSVTAPCTRLKRERTEGKKREVLHLLRCYTHTHPARAGSTLKGKRKKEADTRRANGKNSAGGGGEQTDLQNQPTRRNGPDKNSAHTKTPRHITERHAGKLGTKWGTSWWQTGKPKQLLVKQQDSAPKT